MDQHYLDGNGFIMAHQQLTFNFRMSPQTFTRLPCCQQGKNLQTSLIWMLIRYFIGRQDQRPEGLHMCSSNSLSHTTLIYFCWCVWGSWWSKHFLFHFSVFLCPTLVCFLSRTEWRFRTLKTSVGIPYALTCSPPIYSSAMTSAITDSGQTCK